MGVLDNYFKMGLGTSRLPIKNLDDEAGIEKAFLLIRDSLEAGINYIDTASPYASGSAHAALKKAFAQAGKPFGVTVKVVHQSDRTADDAVRRAEQQLKALCIERAEFFVCWCIQNYTQFLEITAKGGIYDGAVKLKDQGMINHICCSLHAPAEDSIKILRSGLFEAATVSFNLSNAVQMIPVLDTAAECNVDVAVMNPLGGGGIPQNIGFFSFAQAPDEHTVTAALRFAKAHPAVKVVVCGLSNESELRENMAAFTEHFEEPDSKRLTRVLRSIKDIDGYCVNCHYCDICTVNIPVSKIMSKRNRLLFPDIATQDYRRSDPELLQNINLFQGQIHSEESGDWFPKTSENPCIGCGRCEEICTQKLGIIESIENMYARATKTGFSLKSHEDRLRELLVGKGYKTVGLYPKDRFADLIIRLYKQFFGEPDFKWIAFNSDPSMWGRVIDGLKIHSPQDIHEARPDIIIVCNYAYQEEIYDNLRHYEDDGISIVRLHRKDDLPWIF